MKTQKTLIQIQDECIETINAGRERWAHSKRHSLHSNGFHGHAPRILRGARTRATKQLRRWGYNDQQIDQILKQAREVADLNYYADHAEQYDELNHA